MMSVALTVVVAPLVILPLLVLLNDRRYAGGHTSGPFGNGFLAALSIISAIMALIVIPLQVLGG